MAHYAERYRLVFPWGCKYIRCLPTVLSDSAARPCFEVETCTISTSQRPSDCTCPGLSARFGVPRSHHLQSDGMWTDTGSMVLFKPIALGRGVAHLIQRREDTSLHFDMIGALLGRAVCRLVIGSRNPVSALYQIVEGYRPVPNLHTSVLIEELDYSNFHRPKYLKERKCTRILAYSASWSYQNTLGNLDRLHLCIALSPVLSTHQPSFTRIVKRSILPLNNNAPFSANTMWSNDCLGLT